MLVFYKAYVIFQFMHIYGVCGCVNKMSGNFQSLIYFVFLHFSLQYFTSSQTLAHFFLQQNGLPQMRQILEGKFSFFIVFISAFADFIHANVAL